MPISFLLHLYQPSYQSRGVFERIYNNSYEPLLRVIDKNKVPFTLNIPLSLLELMDKYGKNIWLENLRRLIKNDLVEITGSAAYHPLLTELAEDYVYKQIQLNSFGLAYYLGSTQNFEGFSKYYVKRLNGFFPPEMSVNNMIVNYISSMGFSWIMAEEIPELNQVGISKLKPNSNIKIVHRNRKISNMLAFTRGNILNYEFNDKDDYGVVALDGETFGEHNKNGISLINNILKELLFNKIDVITVSDYIEWYINVKDYKINIIDTIDSTWSIYDKSNTIVDPLHIWKSNDNNIQNILWRINKYIQKEINIDIRSDEELNIPLWDLNKVHNTLKDNKLYKNIKLYVLLLRCMNSDQFWWSSGYEILDGVNLYDKTQIEKTLAIYEKIIMLIDNKNISNTLKSYLQEIKIILKENTNE